MTLLDQPTPRHQCGPNEYGYWGEHCWDPAGTVRRCEGCGRTWVALAPARESGQMYNRWRPERRIERWWRNRRRAPHTDKTAGDPA